MVDLNWWTPERVEELKKLWIEKIPAKEIARIMGATSRNAVLGKIHRLKLSNTREHIKPSHPPRPRPVMTHDHYGTPLPPPKKPKPRPKPPSVTKIKQIISGYPEGVLLMDRRWDQCAYPVNGGNPFRFCGAKIVVDTKYRPYCNKHLRIMYGRR